MIPTRRHLFSRLFASAAALTWTASSNPSRADDQAVPGVAYHLSDVDKVAFVLGNIENHLDGVGGPKNVRIVLVVHGPALALFQQKMANADIRRRLARIFGDGVGLAACGNTMTAQSVELEDLLPGFERADEGGVVRLARLQAEGYAYLRP